MSFVTSLLLSLAAAQPLSCPSQTGTKFSWAKTKYVVAFGDSYTYVQGTAGHQNYSFIGDAFNLAFTPQTLLDDRIVQNQTSTAEGGPNWVEYLTGCGLKPGLTDPQTCSRQLWDFAFAGSDISTEYTPLHHNYTVSLFNQTEQFEQYGNPVLENHVGIAKDKTLVAVWIGINDINDSDSYAVDFQSFYDKLVGTLFDRMRRIYALGYRQFLFVNLPPLDRTPGNVGRVGGALPNATMIDWYGEALEKYSDEFGKVDRVWSKVFDANTFLNGVMDDPATYGIKNVTGYCELLPEVDEETTEVSADRVCRQVVRSAVHQYRPGAIRLLAARPVLVSTLG